MPNGTDVKTKKGLKNYCNSNSLDYDKIYNELITNIFCVYMDK